jgi:hypothetical protein
MENFQPENMVSKPVRGIKYQQGGLQMNPSISQCPTSGEKEKNQIHTNLSSQSCFTKHPTKPIKFRREE